MQNDFLLTGFLRTWILLEARNCGQVHGLGIIKALAVMDHRVSAGTVYPLLQRLEDMGYLRRANLEYEKRRVSYCLTQTGEWELNKMMMTIDAYTQSHQSPTGRTT